MKRLCSAFLTVLILCTLLPVRTNAADGDNPVPKAKQAVVSIVAGITYDDSGEITHWDEEAGRGTGFGIGQEGEDAQTFVTNRHVVMVGNEIYDTVYVHIDGADILDGETLIKCNVLYVGEDADYAIIQAKTPIKGVSTLPLLPAERMETGDRVYALGFPGIADEFTDGNQYTVEDITVTDGIVSRYITSTDKFSDAYGVPEKLIAHTASINHGNSGGPLINELGQVIGINTYGFSDSIAYNEETEQYELTGGTDNRYYATYIDYAMAALDELGIEYVDASKPVQQEKSAGAVNYVVVIATAVCVVALAVIIFVVGKRKKEEQLVVMGTSGILKGQMWELKGTLRVGRDPSGDIVYPPDTKGVSRNHCTIRVYKEGNEKYIEVKDLGSTYGTYAYGSNRRWTNAKVSAKNAFCRFSVGSDENSLVITSKLLAEEKIEKDTRIVGGK